MREVLGQLLGSWRRGEVVALATVIHTEQSAPRPAGASMVVLADGTVDGSVSGGCVEGAVYDLAQTVITRSRPALERFGYSDEQAFAVGLTCGGTIEVFVEPVSATTHPELGRIAADVEAGRPVAVATVVEHPADEWIGRRIVVRPDSVVGSLGLERADAAVIDDARGLLDVGTTGTLTYGPEGQRMETGMRVFVASLRERPRMIVFGAIDFAAAVADQGALLGYHVTVCDARGVFATAARFPGADDVVVAWPHVYLAEQAAGGRVDRRTVICVLTHDPKFDVPVLDVALRLGGDHRPAFVGAMGSRRTHVERLDRLREAGLSEEQLSVLASPIGLDLGGRTPAETAVSIMAEIIARRWGGSAQPLSRSAGGVHHEHNPGPR
ncbi:XshC-Cox1 family protein [Aeromicrobium sp. A1-2]|uniref:XdhC family protein n=1 Tax=Aeromicrobium sp. A1-2 TaxID=2107713 RepID=UPI000E520D0D|nr:XdhC/CoxI family protein [Aeromicrobium sp. A1-2]AXT85962.1 XshC-Cox1 family protein [Aeromicrobium sp. A1-2]